MDAAALDYRQLHGSHVPYRGAAPGAGNLFEWTVPGSVEAEVLAVSFQLVTSNHVSDRFPAIRFLDWGGEAFCEVALPFATQASHAVQVTFGVGIVQFGALNSTHAGAGIPAMRLGDGLSFQLDAPALQAGDALSQIAFFVRQWNVRPDDE